MSNTTKKNKKVNTIKSKAKTRCYIIRNEMGTVLGVYKTKEKALKVLDFIQIHLLDLENAKNKEFTLNNFVFRHCLT